MTAYHGTVAEFQPDTEDWVSYSERLQYYFDANDVASEDKKRSILLSVCGIPTLKLIKGLLQADKVKTTPYSEIVKAVKDFYVPPPSRIVQRFKFNTRNREKGESIAQFVTCLRQISENCGYGASLKEMLRDRLVCGVNHDGIQRKLLSEKDLTYDRAYELSMAVEAAERNTKDLKISRPATSSVNGQFDNVHYSAFSPMKSSSQSTNSSVSCYCCGNAHLANVCRFRDTVCRYCKKKGHLERVCRTKAQSGAVSRSIHRRPATTTSTSDHPTHPSSTNSFDHSRPRKHHYLTAEDEYNCSQPNSYGMFQLSGQYHDPIILEVVMNDVSIQMEMDTGASVSIISDQAYHFLCQQSDKPSLKLNKSDLKLKTYTGQHIEIMGTTEVKVSYNNKSIVLPVYVVCGVGPNLMGRDWLSQFSVALKMPVNKVETCPLLNETLLKYDSIFNDELGCLQGHTIQIMVKDNITPKFFKPRTVPYILKKMVEEELTRLQDKGIISPVQHSAWAAPIVPIVKKDGTIRICGDFKVTINQAIHVESYPLPRVDELFANLSNGKYFSKLDLSNAYLQLPLDEDSQKLVTIHTHKGLFKYHRLPFGVSTAPAIFQRCMETISRGQTGVSVYLDDILITGSTMQEHAKNLEAVLQKLSKAGFKLNRQKCSFMKERIEYLGHVIDSEGLHPSEEKVKALKEAPAPKNLAELRAFLGLINYYCRFLSNLSSKLSPLYSLLSKQSKWKWGQKEQESFQIAKDALQQDSVVVHYDESKPLILSCDASQYGLGAVLSHVMEKSEERPVAFASRTLNAMEKKYSQLEKEALAIIFGIKKFHNYLYGRNFEIESDHQPLSFLFKENKGIPQMASSRIQRWALTLSAYQYSIRYKPGKLLCNADALSRLPQQSTVSEDGITGEVMHLFNHLSSTGFSSEHIRKWTASDPILSQVHRFILTGWPQNMDSKFQSYSS